MLITFTSKSAASVLMYEAHAKPILDLLGKSTQRGVITAEEVPDAIARISSAIADSKRPPDAGSLGAAPGTMSDEEDDKTSEARVSFAARAFPLLEMLQAAQRDHQFVMWG